MAPLGHLLLSLPPILRSFPYTRELSKNRTNYLSLKEFLSFAVYN